MTNTRRILLITVAVLVAVPMWGNEIQAQMTPYGSPAGAATSQIQGKITSVDPSGNMVTLDNGTQLTIPATLNFQRDNLKEGAIVKANFEERDGQKVVTSLQVTPAH
jgi:Cu/Ag efflux protein CusF